MTTDRHAQDRSQANLGWATLARLSRLIGLEKRILGILFSYAVAIGLFSLIVPLTVQELVNTFAFAIQPVMIVTLAGIMLAGLLFIGAFKVLQARGAETLQQRIYTRVALAMTEHLPRLREETFLPRHVNHFIEAEFLTRAVVAMLIDAINVLISGTIGMIILVMYHPYFLGYNVLLIGGFVLVVAVFGQGGIPDHAAHVSPQLRSVQLAAGRRSQPLTLQSDGEHAALAQEDGRSRARLRQGEANQVGYSHRTPV